MTIKGFFNALLGIHEDRRYVSDYQKEFEKGSGHRSIS
jgi:hypothetical protein